MKLALKYLWLAVIYLTLSNLGCISPATKPKLIQPEPALQAALLNLFKLTSLPTPSNISQAITLSQDHWLRLPTEEHFHLSEHYADRKKLILLNFDNLGLLDPIEPTRQFYEYVFLLGTTLDDFQARLAFLREALKRGLAIHQLIMLGSLRPLEEISEIKPLVKLFPGQRLITEIDMMMALILEPPIAQLLNGSKIVKVASAMKTLANKRLLRDNTKDTIVDFLATKPPASSVLAISSQPFITRQHLVINGLLTKDWNLETAGPAADLSLPTSIYLDELARMLYERRFSNI